MKYVGSHYTLDNYFKGAYGANDALFSSQSNDQIWGIDLWNWYVTNIQTLFLIKRYIMNAFSAVQWDTHIDWIQWTHTYIQWNAIHIHTLIEAFWRRYVFYFMHTHIHTCVGVVCEPSRLNLLSSSSFVTCELSTGGNTFDLALVQPLLPFVQPIVMLLLTLAWNQTRALVW